MSLEKVIDNINREINGLPISKITNPMKLKTWEEVCVFNGIKEENVLPYLVPKNKLEKVLNATVKINYISSALNGTWIPNFNDEKQRKYFVYFKKSAGGWSVCVAGYHYVGTFVGSGLYFETEQKALYAGNTFLNIFIDYLPE